MARAVVAHVADPLFLAVHGQEGDEVAEVGHWLRHVGRRAGRDGQVGGPLVARERFEPAVPQLGGGGGDVLFAPLRHVEGLLGRLLLLPLLPFLPLLPLLPFLLRRLLGDDDHGSLPGRKDRVGGLGRVWTVDLVERFPGQLGRGFFPRRRRRRQCLGALFDGGVGHHHLVLKVPEVLVDDVLLHQGFLLLLQNHLGRGEQAGHGVGGNDQNIA